MRTYPIVIGLIVIIVLLLMVSALQDRAFTSSLISPIGL
jgi:hypothetical protein